MEQNKDITFFENLIKKYYQSIKKHEKYMSKSQLDMHYMNLAELTIRYINKIDIKN